VEFIRTAAHDLENDQNTLTVRAARVRDWLESLVSVDLEDAALTQRTETLMSLGFKNFDAFHLASAELAGADVFGTCDDRLMAAARRHAGGLKIRVANPLDLITEVFP
jgi:predicted nucleic acid-binding protein